MTSETGSRAALAVIAIICGAMGFVVSMAAVPAQSTALAADALLFLRESALAWLAMWIAVGAFHRTALIARLIGMVMIALGAGVLAIAVGRLSVGSHPEPMTMAGFGAIALAAQIATGALALRHRGERISIGAVWRVSRDACMAHLLVIAAAAVTAFLKIRYGDIVVGAAIAAMYVVNGLIMVVSGRLPAPAEG